MALYDFLDGPPAPLNSQLMEKVNHYNCTKKIDFSTGPSVKFVLAFVDSISKKNGGKFFYPKKDHKKYVFFRNPSLRSKSFFVMK